MAQASLSDLISAAQSGTQLISFPTDTVPALAARPDRASLIFEAKRRSMDKPLILMGASAADLWPYVSGSPSERAAWEQLVAQHWPGALTLVLPASDRIPKAMNPLDPTTLGIRVPDSAIARHILAQTGPLATTSVNRSGQPALTTLAEINAEFPEVLTLTSEGLKDLGRSLGQTADAPTTPKTAESGVPSTVAKWHGAGWAVLRQGNIRIDGTTGDVL